MSRNSLSGVLGTSRDVPAGSGEDRRDQALVKREAGCSQRLHFVFPFCTAARASPTSASRWANSIASTDRRGCSTISSGRSISLRCFCTAALIRRRIRLRSTAPPRTFPTVNPIRGPALSLRRR